MTQINYNSPEYRFKDNLPKAFIPTNLYAKAQDGVMRKIKYVDIRGYYPDGKIGIDQYYHSNFAVFQKTNLDQLKQIDGYENAVEFDEFFKMFYSAFKNQTQLNPKINAKSDCIYYKNCVRNSCEQCYLFSNVEDKLFVEEIETQINP